MHIMVSNAASAGALTAIYMPLHARLKTQLCRLKNAYTAVSLRCHLQNSPVLRSRLAALVPVEYICVVPAW